MWIRWLFVRRDHRAVTLTTPWGETVKIDEPLAPSMMFLWGRGIRTFNSCQGRGDSAGEDAPARARKGYVHLETTDVQQTLMLLRLVGLTGVEVADVKMDHGALIWFDAV